MMGKWKKDDKLSTEIHHHSKHDPDEKMIKKECQLKLRECYADEIIPKA